MMRGDYLIALARRHVAARDYASASLCFESALSIDPASEVALGGMGHCLGKLGRAREAIDCLLRAAKLLQRRARRSGEAGPLLDIAHELHLVDAFEESLQAIDAALKVAPASARGHHLKAQALSRLNQPAAARKSAARAYSLAPKASNAAILLATIEMELGNAAQARTLLEPVVADPSDPNRARALFELGRALDRLGSCEAAFERLAQAGALMLDSAAVRRYDLQAIYRELETERSHCTREWFRDGRPAGVADGIADPVFMVGFYRSGSTLLGQILDAHPRIVTSDERDLVPRVLRDLEQLAPGGARHWTQRLEAIGKQGVSELRRRYWKHVEDRLGAPMDASRVFIDKTTLNTINVGFIHALFPTASILFALRDPRDVCLSCFMQAFTPNALTSHFFDWEEGARFYDAVMRHWTLMQHQLDLRCAMVRYETLIRDLGAGIGPALDLLGLEWDPAMQSFHQQARAKVIATPSFADVARPLYRSAEGRWHRYAGRFDAIDAYLRPHIDRYGYGE
jgi:tetratricopeptide (TPR) repeat protein